MGGTNKKLTTAVETYLDDLRRIRASGGATGERSSYGPLANLLNAVGAALKPKVFCVGELADQGAGHPDFGLYTAKQVQRGRPREGQAPERGVVEVKSPHEDLRAPAVREQVVRYWGRYRLVLVTNLREFGLVGPDPDGGEAMLESFRLAESEEAFARRLEHPRAFARAVGAGLGEYLSRALSHRAALTAGWGHFGQGDTVMPGRGRVVERAHTPDERAAFDDASTILGETTFDIHLNRRACWRNVPAAVWRYKLGGYQVLKKWLSYREHDILARPLRPEEVQHFTDTARRIAAILMTVLSVPG